MWCGNFFWGWKVAKSMVQAKAWKCIEASPRWRALRSGSYIKQLYITWWRQRRFTQVRVAKRWASCWMHFTHLIPLFPIYLPFGALKCCKGIVRSFARSACTTFVYSTLVALLDSVVQAKKSFFANASSSPPLSILHQQIGCCNSRTTRKSFSRVVGKDFVFFHAIFDLVPHELRRDDDAEWVKIFQLMSATYTYTMRRFFGIF